MPGILGKILGTAGGAAAAEPIEAVGNAIDKIFTSKDEKLTHQEILEKLRQRPSEVMQELNKIEARHRSLFVAGWRPAIGWVCGLALFYNFIIRDLIAWGMTILTPGLAHPPALQMEHLMPILLGMLGLGAYRTIEKARGVSK
jgi:hypothetical protein